MLYLSLIIYNNLLIKLARKNITLENIELTAAGTQVKLFPKEATAK